uniref:Usher syndrome 1C n=1 Tax=Eptatretus burgeri TaxID=7764 RepID=A0A8C4PZE6_EPTBU
MINTFVVERWKRQSRGNSGTSMTSAYPETCFPSQNPDVCCGSSISASTFPNPDTWCGWALPASGETPTRKADRMKRGPHHACLRNGWGHIKIEQLIDNEAEKEYLYDVLRMYEQSMDVPILVGDLKLLVTNPGRLSLFDCVRPLILLKHQMEYARLIPYTTRKLREVRLDRQGAESLGLSVRGGLEFNCGLFISAVIPGGQAETFGIRVGDEVVRVNGYSVSCCTHGEVLSLMRSRKVLALTLRHIGMLPIKSSLDEPLKWQFVVNSAVFIGGEGSRSGPGHQGGRDSLLKERKFFISLVGTRGLGCSVTSGPHQKPGVYVSHVKPGSVSEEVGLEVGDQIIEVNGVDFSNIEHVEAVKILKSSRTLTITVLNGAGRDMFRSAEELAAERQKHELQRRELLQQKREAVEEARLQREQEEVEQRRRAESKQLREDAEARFELELQQIKEEEDELQKELEVEWPSQQADGRSTEAFHTYSAPSKSKGIDGRRASKTGEHEGVQEGFQKYSEDFDPLTMFTADQIGDREVRKLHIKKNGPLDLGLEGGRGSPLAGRVVVAAVYEGGAADKHGGVAIGDELLAVDGYKLLDMRLEQAQAQLEQAWKRNADWIDLVIAVAPPKPYEDEQTLF